MVVFENGSHYIAEEERQIWLAIERKRQWLSRKAGREVGIEAAKQAFLTADFEAFVDGYRNSHCILKRRVCA